MEAADLDDKKPDIFYSGFNLSSAVRVRSMESENLKKSNVI